MNTTKPTHPATIYIYPQFYQVQYMGEAHLESMKFYDLSDAKQYAREISGRVKPIIVKGGI